MTSILLLGSGAIGSYYTGKLQQSGADVSVICRSDYDTVKKNGISIKSILGDFTYMPDEVIKKASEYSSDPDYLIVATKVLPEIDIVSLIKDKVKKNTSIVLLQNGINIEKPVAEAFPDNEIISGLAFICVSRIKPGEVDHQDYGSLTIGKYPKGKSEKVNHLAELLRKSGVECNVDDDIISARWKKLVWNAPFNPISVLAGGVNTKEMIESEETLAVVRKVMEEVLLLAEKTGHPLPAEFIENNINATYKMTPYKTSMLLDYENRRPMEVEAILGNALKIARENNLLVPHIESLYGLLKLKDLKNKI